MFGRLAVALPAAGPDIPLKVAPEPMQPLCNGRNGRRHDGIKRRENNRCGAIRRRGQEGDCTFQGDGAASDGQHLVLRRVHGGNGVGESVQWPTGTDTVCTPENGPTSTSSSSPRVSKVRRTRCMCRTISSPSSCSRPINQAGWWSHDTEGGRVNDVGSPVYERQCGRVRPWLAAHRMRHVPRDATLRRGGWPSASSPQSTHRPARGKHAVRVSKWR